MVCQRVVTILIMTQFRRFKVLTVLNRCRSCHTMETIVVMNSLQVLQAFLFKTNAFCHNNGKLALGIH